MKKFAVQTISLMIILFGSLYFFNPIGKSPNIDIPFLPKKTVVSNLEINGSVLKVEIADTESKRNKGLSNRESMATDSGMLFVFPKSDKYVFWMKGMKIALDFVWIKDFQVVDLLSQRLGKKMTICRFILRRWSLIKFWKLIPE